MLFSHHKKHMREQQISWSRIKGNLVKVGKKCGSVEEVWKKCARAESHWLTDGY